MVWETLLNPERPKKTSGTGDHRVEFERDYDRAVFSAPVKRLQDKTQVFPLDPSDAVRTRLTHSLEVSTVARGLGTKIANELIRRGIIEVDRLRQIEAIVATCGLIHDLGNPPFGHAGEIAIRDWFKQKQSDLGFEALSRSDPQLTNDFLGFEGNAQTLRLVSKLQLLADYNGLNLTYGTLSVLLKYTASSTEARDKSGGKPPDHARTKTGYFFSENKIVATIREKTGTGGARNPLTFIVEAADDITYSVADIEDAIKKGIISWEKLSGLLPRDKTTLKILEKKMAILNTGASIKPDDLPDDSHASAFRTAYIGVMIEEVFAVFFGNYDRIMSGDYHKELLEDCDGFALLTALKKLASEYIFSWPQTLKLELLGRHIIFELMDLFWEGASELDLKEDPSTKTFAGKLGALLSKNYRSILIHSCTEEKLPEKYCRLQLVTDYICGMTDSFAKALHEDLVNGA